MNLEKLFFLSTALALTAVSGWSQATSSTVLTQGHNPVEVVYENSEWSFFVDGTETGNPRFVPEEAIYHLTDAAMLQIPANPNFSFLGEAGSPVWIAPHIENPDILLLGISGERIAPGTFTNDRLNLNLVQVNGPGDFAMYGIGSSGQVTVFQDSRDGITSQDTTVFGIGGHDHQNWAFNAPGHYEITFNTSGTLTGGSAVTSPEIIYFFAVGDVDPIPPAGQIAVDQGDADIAVVMDGDSLVLEVFWGAVEEAYANDEAFYRVKPNSRISVPDDSAYAFLGSPGDVVWIAPQEDVAGKLFLALAADNLPEGIFVDDRVSVTMKSLEGPGNFSAYQTDAFGTPTVYYDTSDGISPDDVRDVIAGDHYHMNWGFTEPGVYTVGFEAHGTRISDSQEVVSPITAFTFEVLPWVISTEINNENQDEKVLTLGWSSDASASYQLQVQDVINSDEWQDEGEPIAGTGDRLSVDVPVVPSNSARFYQIEETWPE